MNQLHMQYSLKSSSGRQQYYILAVFCYVYVNVIQFRNKNCIIQLCLSQLVKATLLRSLLYNYCLLYILLQIEKVNKCSSSICSMHVFLKYSGKLFEWHWKRISDLILLKLHHYFYLKLYEKVPVTCQETAVALQMFSFSAI